jgi:tellurite methyltransferase
MSARDRLHWDERYRQYPDDHYPDPDPLLFEFTPFVPRDGRERRALDLACGLGQNGLWLSEQGYSTDLLDISREALRRAQEQAAARKLKNLNFLQVDLEEAALQNEAYDVVCVFRFLIRALFPRIKLAVRPGGRVIYQTFNLNYLNHKPIFNPDYLLQPGELLRAFEDWRVLHSQELDHISQIVAVRPE